MINRIAVLSLLCASLFSCIGETSSNGAGETDEAPVDGASAGVAVTYDGPPATFTVTPSASSTRFQWSVTAPTGGWELKFTGAGYDPKTTHAFVKTELIRPAPGEIVTQAMETLSAEYTHGAIAFESAELRITIRTRGEDTPDDYRVAAVWP